MRIKKTSQTTTTQAQVVDGYSTSTIDSYSCNYVNNKIAKNIITCRLETTANYSDDSTIPLDDVTSIGNKLTYSNSKIKIGAGVSKILVSGQIYINYGATNDKVYGFGIKKVSNSTTTDINGTRTQKSIGQPITIACSSNLVSVQENDEIYMKFVTDSGSSPIVANNTFITVEVVE